MSHEIAAAARAVAAVDAGRRLPEGLAEVAPGLPEPSRAAVRDLAADVLRHWGTLRAIAARLNQRTPEPLLAAAQAIGLAQLREPLRAEAIIVDQTVAAVRRLAPDGAAGFVNATLRRYLREREALHAAIAGEPEAVWNFPLWWIETLQRDHPEHWESILEVSNMPPPLTVRVNRRRATLAQARARLEAAGFEVRTVGAEALVVSPAVAVGRLPGFDEGWLSVQDAGAQLACDLLELRPGMRVLDACAAPGGKTAHILERCDVALLALDIDARRLPAIQANLRRLGLRAQVRAGDAARPSDWWDGEPFDRILVDAPCTASGIVRRHPDIRWLRQRRDPETFGDQQSAMLAALWPLLRPGGTLVFSTCSVFRAEGEGVAERFERGPAQGRRQPLTWTPVGAQAPEPLSQLLPTATPQRDHDGFFYARFVR